MARETPDASGRAKLAAYALFVSAGVDVLGSIVSCVKLAMGPAASTGSSEDVGLQTASVALVDIADGLVGLLQTVVFITTAVLFLRWWYWMAKNAVARGISFGTTPGWAVGFWFVPFANLLKPAQVAKAVANGLGITAPISAWWALWVLSNIASQVSARMNLAEINGAADTSAVADLAAQLLSIPAALVCVAVIRAIQNGLSGTASASVLHNRITIPSAA
jgi:hypothetical protein